MLPYGKALRWKDVVFNKYKTFSVLIYSYINTSGNWENEKLCGNTLPEGRSIFTQFRVETSLNKIGEWKVFKAILIPLGNSRNPSGREQLYL
jgi:hypothetical protein